MKYYEKIEGILALFFIIKVMKYNRGFYCLIWNLNRASEFHNFYYEKMVDKMLNLWYNINQTIEKRRF